MGLRSGLSISGTYQQCRGQARVYQQNLQNSIPQQPGWERDSLSSSSSTVPENSIIFLSSISAVEPSYSVARLLELFKDYRQERLQGRQATWIEILLHPGNYKEVGRQLKNKRDPLCYVLDCVQYVKVPSWLPTVPLPAVPPILKPGSAFTIYV